MANLTTAGATFLAQATINEAGTSFFTSGTTPSGAHLASGDSNTAFAIAQTDLVAATNKLRKSATVTRATNVLTFVASFATGEANWDWEEVGVFNASTGGTMLARKAESLGTKSSGQVWTLTVTATYTAS